MKQKLERNIAMIFRATEKEREMIRKRQKQSGIINMRAYLLKMAIDGRVISIELESVHEMNRLLSNVSNNVNQIAKRINRGLNEYSVQHESHHSGEGNIMQNAFKFLIFFVVKSINYYRSSII